MRNFQTWIFMAIMMIAMSCSKKTVDPSDTQSDNKPQMTEVNLFETVTYEDRISITLSNESTQSIESIFEAYEMKLINRLSRSQIVYAFEFNPKKITLDDLITLCEKEEMIIAAKKITYTSKKRK